MRFRRWRPTLLALVVAAALAGCGAAAQPAPPQTTPPTASTTTTPAAPIPAASAPAGGSAAGSAGGTRYAIVPEKSRASYQAREKFVNRELPNDAMGTTSAISGELILGAKGLQPSTVSVDLRTLKSDEARRDNYIQGRTLQTSQYPMAEFTIASTDPASLSFSAGQETRFKLTGTMKIHGVEKPITWDATGTLQGNALVLKATTSFKLTDFQITPPDLVNMLKVEDGIKLSVELTAQPAG